MFPKKETKFKAFVIPIAHFLGWLLFFSIPFFFHGGHHLPPDRPGPPHMPEKDNILFLSFITNVLLVIIFYLNILFISPVFTAEKKIRRYMIIQLLIFVTYYFLTRAVSYVMTYDFMPMPFAMPIFEYVIVVLVAFCYGLIRENARVEQLQKEKENETLRTELSFLRWQMSPHFLFNVLNNMVALARTRSDKLEEMLLNLSSLMRYMLYETDEHRVYIERETEYLRNYISLQQFRFGNEVKVTANIYVADEVSENDVIEPMLLIPFIENAFKHGASVSNPVIDVYVHFENNMVTMNVKNKYQRDVTRKQEDVKGIGMANVKRRLSLLYPNKHSLHVNDADGFYDVTLGINLL